VTFAEAIKKARALEELTGHPVALNVDAIYSAGELYDMLSEKGKAGTRGAYAKQAEYLERTYGGGK
jgi:hypothetical protein